ncbi:carbonic anhydrase [Flagelloscypha sp. PMI_526]|nr:carbonic anhydrase [Flagelloscypha sp. PMI_526]
MPAQNYLEFQKMNEPYLAEFGDIGKIGIMPKRDLLIITCMDTRFISEAVIGLKEGDAHIIRNAGGVVTDDVFRTILISQRLGQKGTREIAVFHHTGCGMTLFTTDKLRNKIVTEAPHMHEHIKDIDFLEFKDADIEESIRKDVKILKDSPLVLPETVITGWLYETDTGKIRQVV